MAKIDRLFALMDSLRRHRRVVTARELAGEHEVSERTIYRDVQTLQGLGARIEGEAGVGYELRPGYFLPPLHFTPDEWEALVLGLRWAASQPDAELAAAASVALGKVAGVMPTAGTTPVGDVGAWPVLTRHNWVPIPHLARIRQAMRDERTIEIEYADESGRASRRAVWPVHLLFYEGKQVVAAWCCARAAFRHFRADRIAASHPTDRPFGRARHVLAAEWRAAWVAAHPDWFCAVEDPS